MKLLKNFKIIGLIIFGIFSCTSEEHYVEIINDDFSEEVLSATDQEILALSLTLPINYFNYANVELPNFFLDNDLIREDNTPNNNQITNEGATLGRVLFYDKKLSLNNVVSCASCHDQSKGFSDDVALSVGFNGELTVRNSMGLANAKFYRNGRFFWDERANTLENQVLLPIQDHIEMGMTLTDLEIKLANEDYYKVLFRNAFNDAEITAGRISLSLSQFVRSMVSFESKFDEGLSQANNVRDNFTNYTSSENLGKNLFFSNRTNCAECHVTNAFVGDRARNNGLDAILIDFGVGNITGNNNQNGEFKVPSLRNIELTAPYMHDGRFETLREVIEHYNSGIQNSATLDNRLRVGGGNVRQLNLSNQEKEALVDFLITLTDNNFIADEKFSNPFKNEE